jgi:hypothetical protein
VTEKTGTDLITVERQRQISVEGWSAEHDDQHLDGELAVAAACYAMPAFCRTMCSSTPGVQAIWPWGVEWWIPCPTDRVRELVKAGALVAAEIDRLLRVRALEAAKGKDRP